MKKPELLAPVGHMEALKAAVFAGADGVYLGGKDFNARMNATNFSREELAEIVEYCHIFNVKVYITINILLKDNELDKVLEYIHFLYHIGVDALIIQDLGLFYLLKKIFKDLPIHSSTQMFIHSLYGVTLLEELGFERIVLARELTIKEIKHIVVHSKAEIKIFNHGAMCICYSGQCLMSSMIGGRSGNRGSCAQPCRKPYELWTEGKPVDKGHLLSPKDLNSLNIITEVIETGAHSLKIEGRKKSAEYVYTVVSAYRKLIDAYFGGRELTLTDREHLDIEQVFNRQFTNGYLLHDKLNQDELISKDNPRKRGVFLGKVSSIDKEMALITLANHLTIGDGLLIVGKNTEFGEVLTKIADTTGREIEFGVTGQVVKLTFKRKVVVGDEVFKTSDQQLRANLKELIKTEYPRKLPITMEVTLKIHEPLVAKVQYGETEIVFKSNKKVERAIHKPLEPTRIKEQFSKLGNTPFLLSDIIVRAEDNCIIPISEINEVRRELIGDLIRSITNMNRPLIEIKEVEKELQTRSESNRAVEKKLVVKTSRLELLNEISKSKADEIIFGGDIEFNLKEYAKAVELCKGQGKGITLAFPSVTRSPFVQNLLRYVKDIVELEPTGVILSNYELISTFRDTGLLLEADYKLNAFNRFTLLMLQEIGFTSAYLALECNHSEINRIAKNRNMELGLFVHGNTELMVTEYSLFHSTNKAGYLKDKLGYEFPVTTDDTNRTHIFNGKKLSLYDEIKNIKNIDKYRIDITNESIEEVVYTIDGYCERLQDGPKIYEKLTANNPEITKGHFKRGV